MHLNVPLLRSSYEDVLARCPQLPLRLEALFMMRYPEVRRALRAHASPSNPRAGLFAAGLQQLLAEFDDPTKAAQSLRALGARHAGHVHDEAYRWAGACLFAALAAELGTVWDEELAIAWSHAISFACDEAVAGSEGIWIELAGAAE